MQAPIRLLRPPITDLLRVIVLFTGLVLVQVALLALLLAPLIMPLFWMPPISSLPPRQSMLPMEMLLIFSGHFRVPIL